MHVLARVSRVPLQVLVPEYPCTENFVHTSDMRGHVSKETYQGAKETYCILVTCEDPISLMTWYEKNMKNSTCCNLYLVHTPRH